MDLITHFPKSERFDAIFIVIHCFFKLVTFIPFKTSSFSTDLAWLFYKSKVGNYCMPSKVVNNYNGRFLSRF